MVADCSKQGYSKQRKGHDIIKHGVCYIMRSQMSNNQKLLCAVHVSVKLVLTQRV